MWAGLKGVNRLILQDNDLALVNVPWGELETLIPELRELDFTENKPLAEHRVDKCEDFMWDGIKDLLAKGKECAWPQR